MKKENKSMNKEVKNTFKSSQERVYGYDYALLATIIFLVIFGLVMLYSVSYHTALISHGDDLFYMKSQMRSVFLGGIAILVMSILPYWWYRIIAPWYYLFSFGIMFLVLSPIGIESGGARRWIQIPILGQFQPSELMKIGIILFIPMLVCNYRQTKIQLRDGVKLLIPGFIAALVIWQVTDNLSTAIIVGGINFLVLSLVVEKGGQYLLLASIAGLLLLFMVFFLGKYFLPNMDGFRYYRLLVWGQPEVYSKAGGYQVLQGLYAIGAGGIFGKGLGNGTQKLSAIPEVQNDMIFAAICEELGLIGVFILLVLFGFMLYRLLIIAKNAPNLYASLVVAGIFFHIALQVILNIGVVTAILPNTGVTLPFISFGGTALLILLAEMGIALGISRQ